MKYSGPLREDMSETRPLPTLIPCYRHAGFVVTRGTRLAPAVQVNLYPCRRRVLLPRVFVVTHSQCGTWVSDPNRFHDPSHIPKLLRPGICLSRIGEIHEDRIVS